MGNLLSREQLLTKEKLEIVKVEFEDGNFVYVRQMTGHERDTFEQSLLRKTQDSKGKVNYEQATEDFRAKLSVCTVCDESGELILQPGDYPKLSRSMSAKKLETIINKASEINKISEEDKEGIIKNSVADPANNSSSGSVVN